MNSLLKNCGKISSSEKICEIYFGDLTLRKQKEVLGFYGIEKPDEGNLNVFPLGVLCSDEPDN